MENMVITCIQCQEDFEFTVEEQEKMKNRSFGAPLRCPPCRKHKSRFLQHEENTKFKDRKKRCRLKFDYNYD